MHTTRPPNTKSPLPGLAGVTPNSTQSVSPSASSSADTLRDSIRRKMQLLRDKNLCDRVYLFNPKAQHQPPKPPPKLASLNLDSMIRSLPCFSRPYDRHNYTAALTSHVTPFSQFPKRGQFLNGLLVLCPDRDPTAHELRVGYVGNGDISSGMPKPIVRTSVPSANSSPQYLSPISNPTPNPYGGTTPSFSTTTLSLSTTAGHTRPRRPNKLSRTSALALINLVLSIQLPTVPIDPLPPLAPVSGPRGPIRVPSTPAFKTALPMPSDFTWVGHVVSGRSNSMSANDHPGRPAAPHSARRRSNVSDARRPLDEHAHRDRPRPHVLTNPPLRDAIPPWRSANRDISTSKVPKPPLPHHPTPAFHPTFRHAGQNDSNNYMSGQRRFHVPYHCSPHHRINQVRRAQQLPSKNYANLPNAHATSPSLPGNTIPPHPRLALPPPPIIHTPRTASKNADVPSNVPAIRVAHPIPTTTARPRTEQKDRLSQLTAVASKAPSKSPHARNMAGKRPPVVDNGDSDSGELSSPGVAAKPVLPSPIVKSNNPAVSTSKPNAPSSKLAPPPTRATLPVSPPAMEPQIGKVASVLFRTSMAEQARALEMATGGVSKPRKPTGSNVELAVRKGVHRSISGPRLPGSTVNSAPLSGTGSVIRKRKLSEGQKPGSSAGKLGSSSNAVRKRMVSLGNPSVLDVVKDKLEMVPKRKVSEVKSPGLSMAGMDSAINVKPDAVIVRKRKVSEVLPMGLPKDGAVPTPNDKPDLEVVPDQKRKPSKGLAVGSPMDNMDSVTMKPSTTGSIVIRKRKLSEVQDYVPPGSSRRLNVPVENDVHIQKARKVAVPSAGLAFSGNASQILKCVVSAQSLASEKAHRPESQMRGSKSYDQLNSVPRVQAKRNPSPARRFVPGRGASPAMSTNQSPICPPSLQKSGILQPHIPNTVCSPYGVEQADDQWANTPSAYQRKQSLGRSQSPGLLEISKSSYSTPDPWACTPSIVPSVDELNRSPSHSPAPSRYLAYSAPDPWAISPP